MVKICINLVKLWYSFFKNNNITHNNYKHKYKNQVKFAFITVEQIGFRLVVIHNRHVLANKFYNF